MQHYAGRAMGALSFCALAGAEGARGFAKFFVGEPEFLIGAAAGLTHLLRGMGLVKKLRRDLLFLGGEHHIRHILNAPTERRRSGFAVRFNACALNRAGGLRGRNRKTCSDRS